MNTSEYINKPEVYIANLLWLMYQETPEEHKERFREIVKDNWEKYYGEGWIRDG